LRIAQTHNPAARKNVVTATLMNRARMLNKVPEVTFDFWLIKLLAVTVGETAADYMSLDLDLGLATTSWILSGLLMVALALQFLQVRSTGWPVVLISVVGTLVTNNLIDNFGVSLQTTTLVFSVLLAATGGASATLGQKRTDGSNGPCDIRSLPAPNRPALACGGAGVVPIAIWREHERRCPHRCQWPPNFGRRPVPATERAQRRALIPLLSAGAPWGTHSHSLNRRLVATLDDSTVDMNGAMVCRRFTARCGETLGGIECP
jgi:hypothetical protein